jgi:Fe-S-cluster containining protein
MLERIRESINAELMTVAPNESHVALENAQIFAMLTAQGDGGLECSHFDPSTRRCKNYATRPRMCSSFPEYGKGWPCENCSFENAHPDVPGRRYQPIEETGIFAHDEQPVMALRLERMR